MALGAVAPTCSSQCKWPLVEGPAVDVAGPGFPCGVGVEERDLIAVAECVGDQWWRRECEVVVQGRVSCAEQFNSEGPESEHDGVG